MARRPRNAEFERDFARPANEPTPIDPNQPRLVIEEIEIDEDDGPEDRRNPVRVMLFLAVAFAIVVAGYWLW